MCQTFLQQLKSSRSPSISLNIFRNNRTNSGFDADAIDHTTAADLAEVGSDKWTRYPRCIGAFITEMDYGLAPCIQQAIDSACDHYKLGYIPESWKLQVTGRHAPADGGIAG